MTGIPGLLIALILPGLLGVTWLYRFWPSGHPAARLGYGYLLGVLITVLAIRGWVASGPGLHFLPLVWVFLALSVIPLSMGRRRAWPRSTEIGPTWQRWLWWSFLAFLLVRFAGLLLEEILRPLYPWDAWMNWAPKAKVWFSLKELVPFVRPADWPDQSLRNGAYTLGNPEASTYPPLVPLIQLWTALGLGEWRDNWINLPWALCALAFFLAFYGQLRQFGFSPLAGMVAGYLLFSMPYLDTHVALAGYADLWMAAYGTLAAMAFAHWSLTGSRVQAILSILMALGGILTKRPGIIWAAILLPGFLFGLLPPQRRHLFLFLILGTIALLWFLGGLDLEFGDGQHWMLTPDRIQVPGLGAFTLSYHPVGSAFFKNDLWRGNWHLLGWLLLLASPPAILYGLWNRQLIPVTLVILSGLSFLILTFFFTSYYQSALDSSTSNRATLHFLPILFFFTLLSFQTWEKRVFSSLSTQTLRGDWRVLPAREAPA